MLALAFFILIKQTLLMMTSLTSRGDGDFLIGKSRVTCPAVHVASHLKLRRLHN
jgi:hypothetical protein